MATEYTAEEKLHLDFLLMEISHSLLTSYADVDYFRYMAESYEEAKREERKAIRSGRYCPPPPSASDIGETTAEDLWEQVEALECSMYRDDWM